MNSEVKYLSELKRGQNGVIDSFTDYELSLKLLEMGCIPGEKIEVIRIAPLGDPIAISITGYMLSLRKEEAATVRVRIG
ncbi:MAG: ferrous iron transport protein A [Bacteroidetes bacterium]|jgi:ferrous iron transport protein A|nr:ferrous iron transport protein A [Bacteroidota bacterium]MBK9541199.1 ferrous iron transport protein A [Bacteroidota bacterium]MBL0258923.1 ferrous iron transport protein A [Bacteroidota bacterium]MBP6402280.1 ferrous iron transport protein A [Bacteroidia bacterium]MBP6648423.1 ferrous iron transport protein A [Bacteroidia bacterium]